ELLQGVPLGTDEAPAEDVRLVAADADHLAPAGPDREPAGGLAQRTDVVARARAVLHDGRLTHERAADATIAPHSRRSSGRCSVTSGLSAVPARWMWRWSWPRPTSSAPRRRAPRPSDLDGVPSLAHVPLFLHGASCQGGKGGRL